MHLRGTESGQDTSNTASGHDLLSPMPFLQFSSALTGLVGRELSPIRDKENIDVVTLGLQSYWSFIKLTRIFSHFAIDFLLITNLKK